MSASNEGTLRVPAKHAPEWNIHRFRKLTGRTVIYIVLIGLGAIFFLPFVFQVSTSLKAERQIFVYPPIWIPNPVIWRNYTDVFDYAPFMRYLLNTLIICSAHLFGTIFTCSLAGYAFARLRAPGRSIVFMVMLGTMMVPWMVTLIPVYILFAELKWINTFQPLMIPALFGSSSFYIFLLRQYYMSLPYELDDCADGRLQLPGHLVAHPYAAHQAGAATVSIFTFMGAWNDFTGPLIFLNDTHKYTLSLGLTVFQQSRSTSWGSAHGRVHDDDPAGHRPVLLHAEAVRAGHRADGAQGLSEMSNA